MQKYSPFDKPINELQPTDLAKLKSVNEGWYVDYKRDLIKAGAMAKVVSAFANTYGGWLFIGVSEHSKDDPVAGDFPGLSERDVDIALQRLRQSAAEHVHPTPFFQTRVLRGPCVEIGLAVGASVVVVEVPQSQTAPHIHKDGRIYRRVADGSEPKPETDRFLLDQLWRRAEPIRKMTREWVEHDPEFSEAEGEVPYLRLLFCVDPWRQGDTRLDKPISAIREILNADGTDLTSVPFDTVYAIAGGFIARQVKGNDPHNYVTTWRMRPNMLSDIVLPLSLYTPNDPDELVEDLDGYHHSARFIGILKKHGHTHPRIADLNFVMNMLRGLVTQYRRLLKLADAKEEFYFKARVLNSWRVVPFIDAETVLDEFEEHGLPMIIDSTVTVPAGDGPESFVHIRRQEPEHDQHRSGEIQAGLLFGCVAAAFGVPVLFESQMESDERVFPYSEFLSTGARAMRVQQHRNERRS